MLAVQIVKDSRIVRFSEAQSNGSYRKETQQPVTPQPCIPVLFLGRKDIPHLVTDRRVSRKQAKFELTEEATHDDNDDEQATNSTTSGFTAEKQEHFVSGSAARVRLTSTGTNPCQVKRAGSSALHLVTNGLSVLLQEGDEVSLIPTGEIHLRIVAIPRSEILLAAGEITVAQSPNQRKQVPTTLALVPFEGPPVIKMKTHVPRQVCEYGPGCFIKNDIHHGAYLHPWDAGRLAASAKSMAQGTITSDIPSWEAHYDRCSLASALPTPLPPPTKNCDCGIPATVKAASKPGPKCGLLHYTCGHFNKNCSFMVFIGAPDCACAQPAALLAVQKEGTNHGRLFWACANHHTATACRFFSWHKSGHSSSGGSSQQQIDTVAIKDRFHALNVLSNKIDGGARDYPKDIPLLASYHHE